MKAIVLVTTTAIAAVCLAWNGERAKDPWKEPGLVADKETAIKIALAIVTPIYGEDIVEKERPYGATLENGFWHVHGHIPEGFAGGVFYVTISHWDGRIIEVGHTM